MICFVTLCAGRARFAGGFEEAGSGGGELWVSGCGGLVEVGGGEVGVAGDVLLEGSGAEGLVVGDEGGAVGGDLGDGGRGFAVGVGLHDVGELVEAEGVCFADLDGREGRVEEVVHEVGCEGGKKRGIRDEGLGIRAGRKTPAGDFVGTFPGSPVEARGDLGVAGAGGRVGEEWVGEEGGGSGCWRAGFGLGSGSGSGFGSGFGIGFGRCVHALLPSRLVGVRDGAQRGLASGCVYVSRSGGG